MASSVVYSEQLLYGSVKNEHSDDWYTCQFCCLTFISRDEWTSHTFDHFTAKQCSDCDTRLIQICDDWFEVHTITKCHSNNDILTLPVKDIENMDQLVDDLEFKQEPVVAAESQCYAQNNAELNAFEEIFAANFNTERDEDDDDDDNNNSDAFSMDASSFGVEFNNGKSQRTFEVTNIREIKQHSDQLQGHHKKNLRNPNSCKHCGREFISFKCLDNHIKRCSRNKRKREYYRSHPHRPASHFICDLCGNGKILKNFPNLINHMHEIHLNKASYKCRMCDKSFHTRYYLRKHIKRHKDVVDAGGEIMDDLDNGLMERRKYRRRMGKQSPADLTCKECGRQFKHYHLLLEHNSIEHMAQNQFQCHKCERYYPNRYYLQKHLKRHAKAEAFGIPVDSLAVDIDDGLKQRGKYIRMGPNEARKSTFDCNECGETFSKFCFLTRHRRAKHNFDNGFQCRKCGRSYPSRYYLEKHYKQHERQENESKLNLNLTDHLDENDGGAAAKNNYDDDPLTLMERKPYVRPHPHQPKTGFICETCDTTYKRYESLKEHMVSKHSSKDSFMCTKCNRMYPNRYYLQKHMKRHQRDQPQEVVDHLDDNLIERNRYLKVHPHRPTSNFVCEFCQKTLSSYYSIREHMRSKHVSKRNRKQQPCTKCGKIFLSMKCLKKHNCYAAKPKIDFKHMCSTCGRLFPDRSKLKDHEQSHMGIMSSCKFCGKQFLHKDSLRKHERMGHAQERRFSCNVDGCEWAFRYPQNLKRHQARRHGMVTNRNACPICSKEFPDSTYHLKRHLKAHLNNTAKEYVPESKSKNTA